MSDGVIIASYEVHCRKCEYPALGLGRTKADARKELKRENWQQVNGLWHCYRCAPAPPQTPQQMESDE